MKLFLCLLFAFFVPQAYADNVVDLTAAMAVKWDDVETPATISDYTLGALVVSSIAVQKDWEHRGAAAAGIASSVAVNQAVKHLVGRMRPDGSENVSFYSGHTSTAFAAASATCLKKADALCYSSLALAASVGYLRMAANKHWLSDVVVGAGVGYAFGRYIPTLIVTF